MKQKYSLSIADVELNVTVDEAPETVEYIVGVIDRKMREILLRSKYCPKTQAALLCALDVCADKVKTKEELEAVRDELATITENLRAEEEKNRKAEALTIALEKEKARIEIENMKLRALLEEAERAGFVSAGGDTAPEKEEAEAPKAASVAEERDGEGKKPQKSRVGAMFELLTFDEI